MTELNAGEVLHRTGSDRAGEVSDAAPLQVVQQGRFEQVASSRDVSVGGGATVLVIAEQNVEKYTALSVAAGSDASHDFELRLQYNSQDSTPGITTLFARIADGGSDQRHHATQTPNLAGRAEVRINNASGSSRDYDVDMWGVV